MNGMRQRQQRQTETQTQERLAQKKLDAESAGAAVEAERQMLRFLQQGGRTSRQLRAEDRLAYLDVIRAGSWRPNAEEAASRGTQYDQGRSMHAAEKAAKRAVDEALAPLIEAAQAEYVAATAEREEMLRRGRLS